MSGKRGAVRRLLGFLSCGSQNVIHISLTSPRFLDTYSRFLAPGSIMHLKTDSQELYDYTLNEVLPTRDVEIIANTADLYLVPADSAGGAVFAEAKLTQTFYERMFLAEGKPITYIKWITR